MAERITHTLIDQANSEPINTPHKKARESQSKGTSIPRTETVLTISNDGDFIILSNPYEEFTRTAFVHEDKNNRQDSKDSK